MIRLRGAFEPLVAAIYGPPDDEREWLVGVRAACMDAFTGFSDVQALTYSYDLEAQRIRLGTVVCSEAIEAVLRESYGLADPLTFRVALEAGPVTQASKAAPTPSPSRERALAGGVSDVIMLSARPSKLRGVALTFSFAEPLSTISTPTRHTLRRLAAHLDAAARLRAAGASAADASSLVDASDAHATLARVKAALDTRSDAARVVDADAARVVELWHGLLSGRYALVERYEARGRRVLLARASSAAEVAARALTARERLVIERLAAGDRAHHVARDFGVGESTISAAATRGLRKLGLRHLAELVELHAALSAGGLAIGVRAAAGRRME